MNKYLLGPSKPARAGLAVAAVMTSVLIGGLIDRLAVDYSNAALLAAKAKPVIVAEKR